MVGFTTAGLGADPALPSTPPSRTRYTRTGRVMFLSDFSPRSSNATSSRPSTWVWTALVTQMPPTSANCSIRAAIFTPSPVAVLEDDVAKIDSDAELDTPIVRHVRVAPSQALLDLDRGTHGIGHTVKLDQQAVAGRLDDTAMVPFDHGINQLDAVRSETGKRAAFVHFHEPTVADHVRRNDCRQPVFHLYRPNISRVKQTPYSLPVKRVQ